MNKTTQANSLSKRQINSLIKHICPTGLSPYIDKEDLYQEAQIAYWDVQQKGKGQAYALTHVRGRIVDFLRKEATWQGAPAKMVDTPKREKSIVNDEGALALFESLVKNTDPKTRRVVEMRWNRLKMDEIASKMGISRGRVSQRLKKFIDKSKKRVDLLKRQGII